MQIEQGALESYVQLLDSMAEEVRKEAAEHKDAVQRKILLGVAAGLEVAACALRDNDPSTALPDAAELLHKYRQARYAYLLKKDHAPFRRRDPKLFVSKVVKHRKK